MTFRTLVLALLLFQAVTPSAAQELLDAPGAVLRGLDKVSGETIDLTVKNGESAALGDLTVSVSGCRFPVDNPANGAFAFITVSEATKAEVFKGWMFAASPALSALDHPRYDVWVLNCIKSEG